MVPGGARAVTEECIGNDVAGSLDDCGFGQWGVVWLWEEENVVPVAER